MKQFEQIKITNDNVIVDFHAIDTQISVVSEGDEYGKSRFICNKKQL